MKPIVRIICDNLQSPIENKIYLDDIMVMARENKKITVEEKYTGAGTLMLGLYCDNSVIRIVSQDGFPIKGRLYANVLDDKHIKDDELLKLFVDIAFVLKADGMIRYRRENDEFWDEYLKDGSRLISNVQSGGKEIENESFNEFLHKQIIEGKINIMLDRLNGLMNSNADEKKIHSVKVELKQLHSQLY